MVWNREPADFVQTQGLPWAVVDRHELGATGLRKTLSRDAADGAETRLARFQIRQSGTSSSTWEFLVLEGGGTVNGARLRPGSYVHVPAGAEFDLVPALPRTTLLLYSFGSLRTDGASTVAPAGPVGVTHLDEVEWRAPTWSGDRELAPGAYAKTLRQDDLGIMMVTAKLPGWSSADEEVHPQYEENFKLSGDTLMGAQGVLRSGAYYFRPPGAWHGPLYTLGGTITVIRADQPITTEYRPAPPGGTIDDLIGPAYGNGALHSYLDPGVLAS